MLEDDEPLMQALQAYHKVDTKLRLRLREVCQERTYPGQYHLLRPGQVANQAWFLLTGSAQMYHVHGQKGEEETLWIWKQGEIVWAIRSFCRRLPCLYYLQLLEECRLLSVHYRDLEELAITFPDYRRLERNLTEAYHARVLHHFHERTSLPARERYVRLMQRTPQLFQKVPAKIIASFLGMSPATLSRLRSAK